MQEKIFIAIPTYNEKENIKKLLQKIFSQPLNNITVIIIDDNSPDGTSEIVENLSTENPIRLFKRRKKMGIGSAYILAFQEAIKEKADIIFEMDADLSHDPDELPNFIKKIKEGYEVVIGSRKISGGKIIGWGIVRKLMSGGAMKISQLLLGLKTKDVTSGFRCYKREALEKVKLDSIKSNGYAFQEEMLYWCEKNNLRIKEIPITFIDRREGKSKLSCAEIINFFINIFKLKIKNGGN